MKRLYSTPKWADRTRRLQKRKLRFYKRKRRGSRPPNTEEVSRAGEERIARNKAIRASRAFVTISAPREFSFVKNTDEILDFLKQVTRRARQGFNIRIDLSQVETLSYDAVLVLLSRIKNPRFLHGMELKGNEPDNPALKHLFSDSGFYDYVERTAAATVPTGTGSIRNRQAFDVEPEKSDELITFASRRLTGSPVAWKGVQRTFLECMSNTKDHASYKIPAQPWWACAHVDESAKKVQFSFVDNGVGIFKSALLTRYERMLRNLGFRDHPTTLKALFSGEMGSRTRLPYRGKGLPAILATETVRNEIENLVIITNDVYAQPARNLYRTMQEDFDGTFVYWEKG